MEVKWCIVESKWIEIPLSSLLNIIIPSLSQYPIMDFQYISLIINGSHEDISEVKHSSKSSMTFKKLMV